MLALCMERKPFLYLYLFSSTKLHQISLPLQPTEVKCQQDAFCEKEKKKREIQMTLTLLMLVEIRRNYSRETLSNRIRLYQRFITPLPKKTHLTICFLVNANPVSTHLLYYEMPKKYRYNICMLI